MAWLSVVTSAVLTLSFLHVTQGMYNSTSLVVSPDGTTVYPCPQADLRQNDIVPTMMGLWYLWEVIQHRDDPKLRDSQHADICPKLNLYSPSATIVKIAWTEKSGEMKYSFKQVDPENQGYWIVWGRQQNVGELKNQTPDQFVGSAQVLEAKPERMVLMFCSSNSKNPSHYSIVMVRNITLQHDMRETHDALLRRGYKEVNIQETCRNEVGSASVPHKSLPITLAVMLSLSMLGWRGA